MIIRNTVPPKHIDIVTLYILLFSSYVPSINKIRYPSHDTITRSPLLDYTRVSPDISITQPRSTEFIETVI